MFFYFKVFQNPAYDSGSNSGDASNIVVVENKPTDEDSTTNDANSKNDKNEDYIDSRSVSEDTTATGSSQKKVVECQDYGEF